MDERNYYFMNRSHIRAFGSWDCNDDFPIPFTECFESADLFRYSYSKDPDLYQNDIVTPAMIVLPPPKKGVRGFFSMCLRPTCAS
ncbi:uncharacterized protein LOC107768446 isoform X3 [Nicotiana tabacum]|uniref:Uncharacterized protein LOC107768446 isoform X3 n=1 Tax=Nicotiana tabacum TaxID=4097 RepID=A0A1S3XTP6_TOBAC|nr:uncharacterized protein LOC104112157 isoform X3 [Nicotiana tomentosiformis]XP_016443062.1 PREDICTED: uncharacterized protein LOC107768446 isoform X3 [Nicotiana tabacum]